jgi:hypothetical protein
LVLKSLDSHPARAASAPYISNYQDGQEVAISKKPPEYCAPGIVLATSHD